MVAPKVKRMIELLNFPGMICVEGEKKRKRMTVKGERHLHINSISWRILLQHLIFTSRITSQKEAKVISHRLISLLEFQISISRGAMREGDAGDDVDICDMRMWMTTMISIMRAAFLAVKINRWSKYEMMQWREKSKMVGVEEGDATK